LTTTSIHSKKIKNICSRGYRCEGSWDYQWN